VPAIRTAGNQRRFGRDAVRRAKVTRVAQRIGLSVREIAAIRQDLPPDAGLAEWERVHAVLVTEA
jgi:MerR family transcriptional regulator, redox-sensitive transcriptional activator SoxR